MKNHSKFSLDNGKNSKGFTLLEILVVLVIVAFIAIAAVTTLTQFLKNKQRLAEAQEKTETIQNAFVLLERDISYAIQRPAKNNDGDLFASMEVYLNNPRNEGELIQFSAAFPIVGSPLQRVQRISWRLIDNTLYRLSWDTLDYDSEDRFINASPSRQKVLSDVDSIAIEVFMGSGDEASVDFLNERVIASEQEVDILYNLPRLIDFRLQKNDGNVYHRLFYLQSKSISVE